MSSMRSEKKKKLVIASVAITVLLALVAGVMIVTVVVTKRGGSSGATVTPFARAVEDVCAPTDYKDTCVNSLADVEFSSEPKGLIRFAFHAAMKNISDAVSKSARLHKSAKDQRTLDALKLCKVLLENSIGDIQRSHDAAGDFDSSKIKQYCDDLKVWLSGAITHQVTCLDAFENTTDDTGQKMKHLLKIARQLTSNGLAIITHITNSWQIPGTNRRQLPENEKDGFPFFLSPAARRLLDADLCSIKPNVVVAKDGSGQFTTINDAIKTVPFNSNVTYVIFIKAGFYQENVVVPQNATNIFFLGEGPTKTIISGNKSYDEIGNTYNTATVGIETFADGFMARDIGIENTAGPFKHQAVALRVSADNAIFYNCIINGYQDTLYTYAYRQYYRDCTISGTIDFIFGDASAVFQNCTIIVKKPRHGQSCMVTAQGRSENRVTSAIVLQNCTICPETELATANPPVQAFLGRPWKEFSRTIIMQSHIDGFIEPEGWAPWNGSFALDTLWYAEYQNRGPGANTSRRVNWKGYQKKITPQDAESFTAGVYLKGDEWIKPTGIPYDSGMMNVFDNV